VNHPAFGLTLDVGHLVCMNELPVGAHVRRWQKWLWNVHLDDMRPGVHDHLPLGEGEVDFADFFAAAEEGQYTGCISVELSRHSHDAVTTARRSMSVLKAHAGSTL
jgi:sugar phosphate isomerase/epimerase